MVNMARVSVLVASFGVVAVSLVGVGPAHGLSTRGRLIAAPASMAAVGDSISLGYATGSPSCDFEGPCSQFSWATGTAVNSHYQRLLRLNPALARHATNA